MLTGIVKDVSWMGTLALDFFFVDSYSSFVTFKTQISTFQFSHYRRPPPAFVIFLAPFLYQSAFYAIYRAPR